MILNDYKLEYADRKEKFYLTNLKTHSFKTFYGEYALVDYLRCLLKYTEHEIQDLLTEGYNNEV